MFDKDNGVVATYPISTPSNSSTWYVPSFAEMEIIHNKIDIVNASILKASGTIISNGKYWMTTLYDSNSYHDLMAYPYDMSSGNWSKTSGTSEEDFEYPVRVVLAF